MTQVDRTRGVAVQSTPQGSTVTASEILDQVDDTKIVALLQRPPAKGGRDGRPAYPPRALLKALLSKYILNLEYDLDLVAQLRRDPDLRETCGFGNKVPSASTFSRFRKRLIPHVEEVERCFAAITKALRPYLPGLGKAVAIDSTDIEAWANGLRAKDKIADTDARWGYRHSARLNTNRGKRKGKKGSPKSQEDDGKGGKAADQMELYFGYKSHVVADADYEIPLGHILTQGNSSDAKMFTKTIDKVRRDNLWLRPDYVIGDRGYDSLANHEAAVQRGMKPIVHIRNSKRKDRTPLYDPVAGAPTCLGQKPMQYVRTDPDTGYHQFRCPGGGCDLKDSFAGARTYCDDAVWEDPYENLRIVGVVARQSEEWKHEYKKRTSIERWNGSAKESRLFDTHRQFTIARVRLHTALSMLTYQATVLAHLVAVGEVQSKTGGSAFYRQMRVDEVQKAGAPGFAMAA